MSKKKQSMKVLGIKIKDLRNIELVEVDMKDHLFIEVNGENGSAKSTLLDALFIAMSGTRYFGRGYPVWRVIRKGQEKALVKATIGNKERQIEIRRSITKRELEDGTVKGGGSLSVTDTDGQKFTQSDLDEMLSEFTVDPLSFSKKSPSKQVEIIKELGGIKTEDLEDMKKQAYEERTEINRAIKWLESKMSEEVPEEATEEIDISALQQERVDISDRNSEVKIKKYHKEQLAEKVQDMKNHIHVLEKKLEEAKGRLKEYQAEAKEVETLEYESTDAVDQKIADAEEFNGKVRRYKEYLEIKKELDTYSEQSINRTEKIKWCDQEKIRRVQDSNLPFKNISFDEEVGVLIDDVPFSQKSQAEQIRISTRIGMEMKQDLRVISIRDGSLLDAESYEVVKELAEDYGYQVLLEKVGEMPGENAIVLRSGKVVSEYEEYQSPKSKAKNMKDKL